MFNPATAPFRGGLDFLRVAEAAAPSVGVEVNAAHVHDVADIELVIAAVAREANGGLISLPDIFLTVHRELTIELAARNLVPTLFHYRYFASAGAGLMHWTNTPERRSISIAFSKGPGRPIFRCKHRPSTKW